MHCVCTTTVILAVLISYWSCAVYGNAVPLANPSDYNFREDDHKKDLKWISVLDDPVSWHSKLQSISDVFQYENRQRLAHSRTQQAKSTLFQEVEEELHRIKASGADEELLQCLACGVAIKTLKELIAHGLNDTIGLIISEVCHSFHVEKPDVCNGLVDLYKDEVIYVLSHLTSKSVSSNYICGVIIGNSCFGEPGSEPEWNITFPDIPKPPVVPPKPPKPGLPKLKVLHLSDIHIDFHYKNGSDADCGKPLCCQDGKPSGGGDPAGYWGDYRVCDIPYRTLEHLFRSLSTNNQFDYILWTGDFASHMVWKLSRTTVLDKLRNLTMLFLKYFPKTPVYSAVGNHDSVLVNSFPPAFITGNRSNSWLYSSLYGDWKFWLPNDTAADISKGGFYTTLVKPGFRIVSLNDNYCNRGNWWLFLNSTDHTGELSWLINILQQAENRGEKVHIIGHIPPGSPECLRTWSWNYYQIVNRYEGVIAGQFFGHKHFDTWEIFYDNDFQRPISVAYAAPSLTTYVNLNPGYRIYEIDGLYPNSSWMVLDHETYIMNLTESNLKGEPAWIKEYSAKSTYNVTSLAPKDWHSITENLLTDNKLFQKYIKYYYKSHTDHVPPCDRKCQKMMVCELRSGLSHDPRPCHDLLGSENKHNLIKSYFTWVEQKRVC